jgi:methanogenic corrinoid protein MtbC1
MPPSLNIAALTRRTGVPPDTIRKWEQRYGVLRPERTSGGQRRYTELDVARVEWLKARLAEGFRIGEAAALLGTGGVALEGADELRDAIVDATRRRDVPALQSAVEQALTVGSPEEAFIHVFTPALVEIGDLWEQAEVSVAQEHLATGVVRSALQRLLADHRGEVRGTAVLACAPGEWHEIGLLMLAVLLRAEGWQIAYLGPNTPAGDALALAESLGAAAVLFSATREESARALEVELLGIDVPETIQVVVGGRATEMPNVADAVAALR